MTKDDVIALPHPHLRRVSQKVGLITDEIRAIVADMEAATISWDRSRDHEVGVALAAVQIDRLFKIVIIRNNYDNKDDTSFTTFINPRIVKYEGVVEDDFEGCLSIKDTYGKVPRHAQVRVAATGITGEPIRLTATGFLARIFQHEIDHTNGILFVDHIRDTHDAFYCLDTDGKLQPLEYEQHIAHNETLWTDNAA